MIQVTKASHVQGDPSDRLPITFSFCRAAANLAELSMHVVIVELPNQSKQTIAPDLIGHPVS